MRFDLHTHHERCGHARGDLRAYIQAAIDAGLDAIGVSDHSPHFAEPEEHALPGVAMAKREFAAYVAEARALRQEYAGRIEVLIGVESDYLPDHLSCYREAFSRQPLDYLIGSVHRLDGVDLFQRERWEGMDTEQLRSARERYCDLVARSAGCGMFDVLGHVDVIKATCPEIAGLATPAVDRMVRAIAAADVTMEINTSGNTKDCGGWYPAPDILERARWHGVKVTFGSDAHDPSRVGEDHEQVRQTLRDIGFRQWYVFRDRRRLSLPV